MTPLKGKAIWTWLTDVKTGVVKAPEVGAQYILCRVSSRGAYVQTEADKALAAVKQDPSLIPIAWTFTYLDDINLETTCIQKAFQDGFKGVIIDAEGHVNFKFKQAEKLAKKVIDLGLDTSQIYLCSDPRLSAKIDEIPVIQLAPMCKGGFMPMIYGEILPYDKANAALTLVKRAYDDYEKYKADMGYINPLMPIISTYWDESGRERMSYAQFKRWCDEIQEHTPTFVSLYRAGVTLNEAWRAFKELEVSEQPPTPQVFVVEPRGTGYSEGVYPPNQPGQGWTEFRDNSGHLTRYRKTAQLQTAWARYMPILSEAGTYVIEVFVPGTHATIRDATYTVVYHKDWERFEAQALINQGKFYDEWISLGVYDLSPYNSEDGRVILVDRSSESKTREIAFSAIRWRMVKA